jgi:hypothetical protein
MIFVLSSLMLEHSMITSQSLLFLYAKFLANFFADFMTGLLVFAAEFSNACFAGAFAQGLPMGISGNHPFASAARFGRVGSPWTARGVRLTRGVP